MIASAATAVVVRTTEAADRHPHSHKNGNRLCSASRIWKAVQDIIARGNLNDWNEFARVDADAAARIKDSLLQSTFHNNRARFAPSQKHKVLQFSNKALLPQAHCKLGKSIKNLNCIQIAMLQDHEPLACALFLFIRDRATAEELGAFMNDCWSNRNTTLHMACFLGMADLVRLYVEAGAALSPKNGRGLTPAECTSREDILALLLAPPPAQDTSSTLVGTLLEDFDVLVPLTKLHVKYTPDAPKYAHHMKVPDIIADSESTTDESEASFGSLPDTGVACDPFDLTNSWLMYHRSPSPVKVRGVPVNDLMNTWYMRACLADMTSIGGSRPTAMARAAVDLTNTWFMGLLRSVQSPQKIHGAPTPVDLGTSWFASVVDDAIVAAGIISQTMIDACDSQLDHLGVCLLFPDRSGSSGQPPSRIDDDDNGACCNVAFCAARRFGNSFPCLLACYCCWYASSRVLCV
ncbi:hypothetical protein BX666DRAFT_1289058 [Dichotomocladium elegans]|nr:hypothetical protein BX666DRAFT_1289058 [Dichotomocladium elegans]